MSRQRVERIVFWIVLILFWLIAGLAFLFSFHSIRLLAERVGVSQNLSWVTPLIIDGSMLVASLSAFLQVLKHEQNENLFTKVKIWSVVIVVALFSFLFNVWLYLFGEGDTSLSVARIAVHWVAPLMLLLSFELNLSNVLSWISAKDYVHPKESLLIRRGNRMKSIAKHWKERYNTSIKANASLGQQLDEQEEITLRLENKMVELQKKYDKLLVSRTQKEVSPKEVKQKVRQGGDGRKEVYDFFRKNPEANKGEACKQLGISYPTLSKRVKELIEEGRLTMSGRQVLAI